MPCGIVWGCADEQKKKPRPPCGHTAHQKTHKTDAAVPMFSVRTAIL